MFLTILITEFIKVNLIARLFRSIASHLLKLLDIEFITIPDPDPISKAFLNYFFLDTYSKI